MNPQWWGTSDPRSPSCGGPFGCTDRTRVPRMGCLTVLPTVFSDSDAVTPFCSDKLAVLLLCLVAYRANFQTRVFGQSRTNCFALLACFSDWVTDVRVALWSWSLTQSFRTSLPAICCLLGLVDVCFHFMAALHCSESGAAVTLPCTAASIGLGPDTHS